MIQIASRRSQGSGPRLLAELYDDRRGIAFAYGGVYPGTLHAHGLVKTRGFLFHRRRRAIFIARGPAAESCRAARISPSSLTSSPVPHTRRRRSCRPQCPPQRGGQGGDLVLRLSDNCGNECIEGGAALQVSVNTEGMKVKCATLATAPTTSHGKVRRLATSNWSATLQGAHIRGHLRRSQC